MARISYRHIQSWSSISYELYPVLGCFKPSKSDVPDAEVHGIIVTDEVGNALVAPPAKPFKYVYEIANMNDMGVVITYRDK